MGPAFMPNLTLGLLAVLSFMLVVQGVRRPGAHPARQALSLAGRISKYRNILYSFGLFFLLAWLFPVLGFVLTSFLFLLLLQVAIGPKEWAKAPFYLGVSVGVTLVLFLIFRCMLLVILPESEFDAMRLLEDGVHVILCDSWEAVSQFWN